MILTSQKLMPFYCGIPQASLVFCQTDLFSWEPLKPASCFQLGFKFCVRSRSKERGRLSVHSIHPSKKGG